MAEPIIKNKNIQDIPITKVVGLEDALANSTGGGNEYNNIFRDSSNSGLTGAVNGVNISFTVSNNEYNVGTLNVYRNGQLYTNGSGITETSPSTGTFTLEDAPNTGDFIYATYQVGTTVSVSLNTVAPEQFGADPTGVVDSSDAFEDAFNDGRKVVLGHNATYLILQNKDFTRAGTIEVEGNGSTIITNPSVRQSRLFLFSTTVDLIKIKDLNVDGKNFLGVAFYIQTNFDFNNIRIKNIYDDVSAALAFRVDVGKQFTTSNFTNCYVDNVNAPIGGSIGDASGACRAIMVNWNYTDEPTQIRIKGGKYSNVFGNDGDIFQLAQANNNHTHNCKTIVEDVILENWSRRAIKGTSSGIELYRVRFISTVVGDPRTIGGTPSGMLTFSIHNSTTTPNERNKYGKAIDCIFDNRNGYDGRILATNTGSLQIKGCTFINSQFVFNSVVGNTELIDNTFQGQSSYMYNTDNPVFEGITNIKRNTYTREAGANGRGLFDLGSNTNTYKNINIENNTIIINTDGTEIVFGIGSFGSGTTLENVLIKNNTILRTVAGSRKELIRIDGDIIGGVSIIGNYQESVDGATGFSSGVGIDINGTGTPLIRDNYHSSGQQYPDSI
ncbi:structural protein [Cellulophaga phage phi4:1]|uniref:Structural protein n=3 Tax=Lightbulbvirus Cba41 TaxID=1918524 RepID=A0A0S2MWF3_9CAUD|nr:tail protein [Cellulophaga phage phi4:1]AGO49463.1 structural protein [Cellulophaga phage phi4:1]ALO80059.1 structural protein [Cellulophaga phage phi4:1_13]ALO80256.1 structural protein [Cellulophaga phage phi4:1_18]